MDEPTEQLDRVTALLLELLDDAVVGLYLHGSAVFGGLRRRSDLDLAAVLSRRTTEPERRRLIERLMPISGRGDPSGRSRSLELTVVAAADVRPWHYPPRMELLYGDWWRADYQAGNFAPWESPNPDLAITLSQVLAANRPLIGPPPAELLEPVPPTDLRQAMLDGIPSLLADLRGDEANVLLTLARIRVSMATGRIVPKDEAAEWVMPWLAREHRLHMERARAVYLGEADDAWVGLEDGVAALAHRLADLTSVA